MRTTQSASPLVALLFVAMALLLAVAQPAVGFIFFFLIPFWFFLADVPSVPPTPIREVRKALPLLALPVFSPRLPPVR
jgi:hypothetical protein